MEKILVKIVLLLLLISLINSPSDAQIIDSLWQRSFDENGHDAGTSVTEAFDGGYLITGSISPDTSEWSYLWLQKLDSGGDSLWRRFYGYGKGWDIQRTSDSGYVIIGEDYNSEDSDRDVYLLKIDQQGDTVFTKKYGDENNQEGSSVKQTSDDGFIISGENGDDLWIIKTDAAGDLLWSKIYDGGNQETALEIETTMDGGYILCAGRDIWGEFGANIWILKLDSAGDTLWTKTIIYDFMDSAKSIEQTADGGYYCLATFQPEVGRVSTLLIKLDANGGTEWMKTLDYAHVNRGNDLIQLKDGRYVVVGSIQTSPGSDEDLWLLLADQSGDTIWTDSFGGTDIDYGNRIYETEDSGLIIGGTSRPFYEASYDAWFVRINPPELTAYFEPDTIDGELPFPVHFYDQSHQVNTLPAESWSWDFDSDGIIDSYEKNPHYTYFTENLFSPTLIINNGIMSDTLTRENLIKTYYAGGPVILSVKDIPDDQGGWVEIEFLRSYYDTTESNYDLYYFPQYFYDGEWIILDSINADGLNQYSLIRPTPVDSTHLTDGIMDFQIIANTIYGRREGNIVQGYSVDNLPPGQPTNLKAGVTGNENIIISWQTAPEDDVDNYRLVRSKFIDFIASDFSVDLVDTSYVDDQVQLDSMYYYRLSVFDKSGNESDVSETVSARISDIYTGVTDIPKTYKVFQNYPNPFNPKTIINYELPITNDVELEVFNMLGQKVATLVSERHNAGRHQVEWDASEFGSGIYYYRFKSGKFQAVNKMILMK